MSTTGGSAWTEIDNAMNDGYAVALGSIYQGGSWDHDDDAVTPGVPAVFRSTDQGLNWSRYALSQSEGVVYSLAVHPTNTDIAYAGGRYSDTANNWVTCLFKTTDGGSSWFEIGAGISSYRLNDLQFDPFNTDKIYAGTDDGVYVSIDGGSNWQPPVVNMVVKCIAVDPNIIHRLFAGSLFGVQVSTDGGSTWTPMNEGLFNEDVNCMDFNATHGVLYVGTHGGGVFRSSVGTVIDAESVSNELPNICTLCQNYPNPFNMSTVIRYELNRHGRVNLSVFDINGRLIKKLVDSHQEVGIKRVTWDGKDSNGHDVSSGLYIYKLQTEKYGEMLKMILQK